MTYSYVQFEFQIKHGMTRSSSSIILHSLNLKEYAPDGSTFKQQNRTQRNDIFEFEPVRNQGGLGEEPPLQNFSPPLEKCVGHTVV